MYIAYETLASNDPRRDDRIQEIGKWWHYVVAYIAPEHESSVRTDWLKGVVLPEDVAKGNKFASSVDGEITVVSTQFNDVNDIVFPSSGGNQAYAKQIYDLTEIDKAHARDFMKAVMKLHIDNHLPTDPSLNPGNTAQRLKTVIDNAGTLNDIQKVLKHYFDVDASAYTAGIKRNPEFEVRW